MSLQKGFEIIFKNSILCNYFSIMNKFNTIQLNFISINYIAPGEQPVSQESVMNRNKIKMLHSCTLLEKYFSRLINREPINLKRANFISWRNYTIITYIIIIYSVLLIYSNNKHFINKYYKHIDMILINTFVSRRKTEIYPKLIIDFL